MDSLDWLLSAVYEDYARHIAEYCKTHRNCETCRFFNGTCRLNSQPFNWTEVNYGLKKELAEKKDTEVSQ